MAIDRYWPGWERLQLRGEGMLMLVVSLRAFGVIRCSWFLVLTPFWLYLAGAVAFCVYDTLRRSRYRRKR